MVDGEIRDTCGEGTDFPEGLGVGGGYPRYPVTLTVNPIKLDLLRCIPCYIPSNDPEYLL